MNVASRLILIGGFLGAGKTASIIRLSQKISSAGLKFAVITNDQAAGLVDTELIKARASIVEEIAGGCFCCRSDELNETIKSLSADRSPDIIIAEPVGSCTDLVATVIKPLEQIYHAQVTIAPFSVVLDPYTLLRTLGIEASSCFAKEIDYIIEKQVEEAELLVVNKTDVISQERLAALRASLQLRRPGCRIFSVSARTGEGCAEWFDLLLTEECKHRPDIDLDYMTYGKGEAKLGWFNGVATVSVANSRHTNPNALLESFALAVKEQLAREAAAIAHLKAVLLIEQGSSLTRRGFQQRATTTDTVMRGQYVVQIGGPDAPITMSESRTDVSFRKGRLLINIRAEAEPSLIDSAVDSALQAISTSATVTLVEKSAFKPNQPTPIHRISAPP